jgi:hypothetical protein
MEQSGFVDRLRKSQQPCTILAPSDEAFQKIPQSRLERIMSDKHAREGMFRYRLSEVYISYQLTVKRKMLFHSFMLDSRSSLSRQILGKQCKIRHGRFSLHLFHLF